MQKISLALTVIMALCAMAGHRKQGRSRSVLTGVGFFVVSCYVDGIFRIIMENGAGEDWRTPLQAVSVFVSKSILLVLLLVLNGMGHTDEDAENYPQVRSHAGRTQEDNGAAEEGWQPMDSLTLGISLLFGILVWWIQCFGRSPADFATALFMVFLLAALAGYYVSCRLYRRGFTRKKLQWESRTRKAEAEIYLEGVEERYQHTRELWHDLKNHVNLLSLLLQEGKYQQMADYLRVFGDDVDSLTLPERSGNLVFDAVLADKTARAKRDQIKVELSLCDLTELELRPDEICGLLGNLLDNALEASVRVREGRFLRMACVDRGNCYYIRIENAFEGGTQKENGGAVLASGKSDHRNRVGHGLGLRSAQRIVHGCGGDLAMESGEGRFVVAVRLPKRRDWK